MELSEKHFKEVPPRLSSKAAEEEVTESQASGENEHLYRAVDEYLCRAAESAIRRR
jgi:hypothetical protein